MVCTPENGKYFSSVNVTLTVQSYYVSNVAPSSSLGNDGDLCLVRAGEQSMATSNITTIAQYEAISMLYVKENNGWINIAKIYKKIDGVWVEQENSDWEELFDVNIKYIQNQTP